MAMLNGSHMDLTGRLQGVRPGRDHIAGDAAVSEPRYRRLDADGFGRGAVAGLLVLLVACGIGDFVNSKTVFDQVFPASSSANAWLLAVSICLLAILATHVAGYLLRESHGRRHLQVAAGLVLAGWLAVGSGLAVLRVVAGRSTVAASQAGNPFAGLGFGSGSPHPFAVAAVLAGVWVVTGITSSVIGFLAHSPAGAALHRLGRRLDGVALALSKALLTETAAAHTVTAQRLQKARLPELYGQAANAVAARGNERRAWARIELIRVLGDPAATNDILPPSTKD